MLKFSLFGECELCMYEYLKIQVKIIWNQIMNIFISMHYVGLTSTIYKVTLSVYRSSKVLEASESFSQNIRVLLKPVHYPGWICLLHSV